MLIDTSDLVYCIPVQFVAFIINYVFIYNYIYIYIYIYIYGAEILERFCRKYSFFKWLYLSNPA